MGWWTSTPGGDPVHLPDGYDETQGTMADAAWVAGSGTVISLLKKIASGGGGSAVTIADGADAAQGTTTDLSSASTVIGLLKALKALLTGTLTTTTSWAAAQHVIVDTAPSTAVTGPATDAQMRATPIPVSVPIPVPVSDNAGSLTVDAPVATPVWVRESDGAAAFVGQKAMAASKPVVIASDQSSIPVAATIAALPVGHNIIDAGSAVVPVNDNAGSLTVDAPVGTPVFIRLSDGAAAIATLPVSLATNTPDVTDRAARLLGVVDKGKIWDGTNIAAVKAASALAVATDPALVVQLSPQSAQASNLCVTATGAAAAAVTATLSAAAAGLFHYITFIQIEAFASALRVAGATPVLVTTTDLPGSPVFSFKANAMAAGDNEIQTVAPATPIKSTTAATATTIVAPVTTSVIWRITVWYYTAP